MKQFIALLCGLVALAMPAVAFADVAPIPRGGGGGWAVFGFAVFIIAVVVLAVVLINRKNAKK